MLKVGIIGVGSMGTQHFLRLMNKINGATVTAVSNINEAHAKEVIAPYPTVRTSTRTEIFFLTVLYSLHSLFSRIHVLFLQGGDFCRRVPRSGATIEYFTPTNGDWTTGRDPVYCNHRIRK